MIKEQIKKKKLLIIFKPAPPGIYVAFKPVKDPGLPQEIREANPKSQIESICYKAYRTWINNDEKSKNKVRLIDEESK